MAVTHPDHEALLRDGFLALAATLWLAYTAVYPVLAPAHRTLPVCPFLLLTGQPCPLCGGTRSFVAMWNGDLSHAARLHPLGPLLFPLTFVVAAYGIWAVLARRSLRIALPLAVQRWITAIALFAVSASWSAKLLWLGN